MLPSPPAHHPHYQFRFIDLFAGIGGIRNGFEAIGGQCVFTSEWNKNAVRTYKANWYNDEQSHRFNQDIREVTLSGKRMSPMRKPTRISTNRSPIMTSCWQVSVPAIQLSRGEQKECPRSRPRF
jgi:hypothetical protein